jgi:hypothetical protein
MRAQAMSDEVTEKRIEEMLEMADREDRPVVRYRTVNLMGRRMRFPIPSYNNNSEEDENLKNYDPYADSLSPEDKERERQMELARQRELNGRRLAALMRARRARGDDKIKAVTDYLAILKSEERISKLVPLIEGEPADIFWPAFSTNWPLCDRTHGWNERLLAAMQRVGPHDSVKCLPETLTVFRGCSRSRIAALSWTTKPSTALCFALGHDGIHVPNPVIAMAHINRSEAFWFSNCRKESEVVCWPKSWSVWRTVDVDCDTTAAASALDWEIEERSHEHHNR